MSVYGDFVGIKRYANRDRNELYRCGGADSMLRAKRLFCAEQGAVSRPLHFICPLNTVSRLCRAISRLRHTLSRLRHTPCRWLRHNFVITFRIKYLQKIRLKICRVKRKSYLCTRNREDGKKRTSWCVSSVG